MYCLGWVGRVGRARVQHVMDQPPSTLALIPTDLEGNVATVPMTCAQFLQSPWGPRVVAECERWTSCGVQAGSGQSVYPESGCWAGD